MLCVPFGCMVSGLLSKPLGKRRVMQVSASCNTESIMGCVRIKLNTQNKLIAFKFIFAVFEFTDARGMGTFLLCHRHHVYLCWTVFGWHEWRSAGSSGNSILQFYWEFSFILSSIASHLTIRYIFSHSHTHTFAVILLFDVRLCTQTKPNDSY